MCTCLWCRSPPQLLLMQSARLSSEFFALMLGVRRPSVTDTLHILEERQCIKAERSLVTIRNRAKLEGLAGDAYGVPEAEYRRLMLSDSSFAG